MPRLFFKLPLRTPPTLARKPIESNLPLPQAQPAKPSRRWLRRGVEVGVGLGILGVLAAILLPATFTCGKLPRLLEGKTYLDSLNRAQQAYLEESGQFAASLTALNGAWEGNLPVATENYTFLVSEHGDRVVHYAIAKDDDLRQFIGAVFKQPKADAADAATAVAILCEAELGEVVELTPPTLQAGTPVCPPGFLNISS
ncbi:MAG: hypothetical protein HC838_11735 [Spirulinaceae cyanobacterium RM2_2_10]|nr:hypothetical protein [Spirulinaceae cyanobacterium SM2_1_0]NJO20571.1 hypothetical protein [Spirulinaceae cyanobacterium RM2_2_10]